MKETVSDEAREDQWGVRSIDKVQHTALSASQVWMTRRKNYIKLCRLVPDTYVKNLPTACKMNSECFGDVFNNNNNNLRLL